MGASIYVVLPLMAAVLYGLNYAILGNVLKTISLATFLFVTLVISIACTAVYMWFQRGQIDLVQLKTHPKLFLLLLLGSLAAWLAWFISATVIKNVNPTFAAIGEVAYPVFVPIFAYFIFAEKQWDMPTLVGGGLVFLGLFVMIYFRTRA